eukprot:TRINITY_DN3241_c0_g1_i4.p1 TRINITY_DN3241_c0_g1~~TRINITY_DN3241_c0_g1_i4.p1  ORF type:complete len:329 (-),score=49.58 TRINITY_DN3241_c0_g1_i4:1183-2169(-)
MSYYHNREGPIAEDELDLTNQWLHNLDDVEINPNLTWLDLTANRLTSVDPRILQLTNLKMLNFRQNLLTDAQFANDLNCKETLEELIFHDNQLSQIPNLENFDKLKRLEFSYNEIRNLAPLKSFKENSNQLKELYVASNKINKIEGLHGFSKLEILELGSNRIQIIENLNFQIDLTELWLARNRISKIEHIAHMHALKKLSLQNNRLENMKGLEELVSIEELYVSFNGIQIIEGINQLINLKILDLANNQIKKIEGIKNLTKLTDLWLDSNQIDQSFEEIEEEVAENVQNSVMILYMDENPISKNKEQYQIKIKEIFKNLKQLDQNDL